MLRKKIAALLMVACVGMMIAGCGSAGNNWREEPPTLAITSESEETQETSSEDQTQEEDDKEVVKADNMTTSTIQVDPMDLKTACERAVFFADWVYVDTKGNTIVSPLSLNIALGLAAEGASGDTAKELYGYLGREDYADFVNDYMAFAEGLEQGYKEGDSSYYTFRYEIANSLWINQKKRLIESYRSEMEEKFRAEVAPVDFEVDIDGTLDKINGWCDEKTHGMIPRIVEKQNIKANLEAILINSVYFESPWAEEWHVREGNFKNLNGETKTLDTLWGSAGSYFENDQAIAFSKRYYNGFEFIGILPKQEGEFSILGLDVESLLKSRSNDYLVSASMPKLNFSTTASKVEDILKSQGIQKPFDITAEFDKIIEEEQLFIDQIIQKCKIELDENGTKAAAVTAITLRANGLFVVDQETKEVILDRPFAFMIYDSVNDEIVFIGKVTDVE